MPRPKTLHKELPVRLRYQHGAYYYVTSVGGRRQWKRLSTDYESALEQWRQLESGHEVETRTMATALDRYLKLRAGELSPRTISEYTRQSVRLKNAFQGFEVADIQPKHIGQYLDAHPHHVAANREISLLSSAINHVRRLGWLRDNPCNGIRRNREHPRTRYLDDKEMEQLRAAGCDQMRALIDIAYLTAMRKGDLLSLRLGDITDRELFIRQQKTGHRQGFLITPALQAAIDQARQVKRHTASLFLFASQAGTPYTISGFNSIWRRLVARSGVPDCHFHDIRAKSLTDAHRARGRDYAQLLAGHASGDMTERYVRDRQTAEIRPLK